MILFDNAFSLSSEFLELEKEKEETVNLVSHAHYDHLPSKYKNTSVYCSPITKKIIELRRKVKEMKEFQTNQIEMLDAGHILGSNMFLINKKLLYTGDFNPQGEYSGKALPVKCSTLIMECTYGRPKYVFPSKKEVIKELVDYIKENNKILISAMDSNFGKAQELCAALNETNIIFNTSQKISDMNQYLGLTYKNYDPTSEQVLITDKVPPFSFEEYKKVHLSGWHVTPEMNMIKGMDKGFVFSSHADYPSLIEFAKKCNPDKIYVHHGFAIEFAQDLRKLGFNASTLSELVKKKSPWKKKSYQTTLF